MKLTLENFKSINVAFRKDGNTLGSNLTSVLIGEVQNSLKLKNLKEEEAVSSFLIKLKKSLVSFPSETGEKELELINSWLPIMMKPEEILTYIQSNYKTSDFSNKGKLTGMVVKALKGKASGLDVSKIIKML
jgi:uncharacterized protein YqeY